MRVIFMGSPEEVIEPLKQLMDLEQKNEIQLVGVISQPARPVGRKRKLQDPPVASFAKEAGIPVFQPEKASAPEFLEELRTLKPDVAITAAYGQILSQKFLEVPERATINIHPSLLPLYRGATPVQSALLEGCQKTGVTILFTVKKMDAGNIILQEEIEVTPGQGTSELLAKLFQIGGAMLPNALNLLSRSDFLGIEQEESKVTHCRKFTKEDGALDFNESAAVLYNRFRAFDIWPGTYSFIGGERVLVESMALPDREDSQLKKGEFELDPSKEFLRVQCGKGQLKIMTLKPAGGKSLRADAFVHRLQGKGTALKFENEA